MVKLDSDEVSRLKEILKEVVGDLKKFRRIPGLRGDAKALENYIQTLE